MRLSPEEDHRILVCLNQASPFGDAQSGKIAQSFIFVHLGHCLQLIIAQLDDLRWCPHPSILWRDLHIRQQWVCEHFNCRFRRVDQKLGPVDFERRSSWNYSVMLIVLYALIFRFLAPFAALMELIEAYTWTFSWRAESGQYEILFAFELDQVWIRHAEVFAIFSAH